MGTNSSKPGLHGAAPSRKALKSRSSLNLLKRTRTPSTSTRASCPLPVTASVDGAGHFEDAISSDVQTATTRSRKSSLLSSTTEENGDDEEESRSVSSVSTSATATRLTTPTGIRKDVLSVLPSEDERPSASSPSSTPKILLPTTSMLPEDSPTKYGLRTVQTPSPDKRLMRAQRKDMTGPGLFAVCLILYHLDVAPSLTEVPA